MILRSGHLLSKEEREKLVDYGMEKLKKNDDFDFKLDILKGEVFGDTVLSGIISYKNEDYVVGSFNMNIDEVIVDALEPFWNALAKLNKTVESFNAVREVGNEILLEWNAFSNSEMILAVSSSIQLDN